MPRAAAPRYAVSIFLSGFLLFQIQPLIASFLLPWYGGSTGVWTTCMLFFQTLLLGGYAYAHWIAQRPPRMQLIAHGVLLVASLVLLPIVPAEMWKSSSPELPVLKILGALTVTVGLPYFVLSANSPLVQRWFADALPDGEPYRLYALSNVASLTGLLSYPILVQPLIALRPQAWAWSGVYVGFLGVCVWCMLPLLRRDATAAPPPVEAAEAAPPARGRMVLWGVYAAVGSALMLAVTNEVTHDIASVPFLWVLPLAVYLLTFVVAFDRPAWYRRKLWIGVFAACLFSKTLWAELIFDLPLVLRLFIEGLVVWSGCLVCHGELARARPSPRYLTGFYLTMSAGGAFGGLFVAVLAPLLFAYFWELPLVLVLALSLGLWRLWRASEPPRRLGVWIPVLAGTVVIAAGLAIPTLIPLLERRVVRNFYGVLRVTEHTSDDEGRFRVIRHGDAIHGLQFLEPGKERQLGSYYTEHTGVAAAFRHHAKRAAGEPLRVGAVGLGAGAVALFTEPGDFLRFYEINPLVETLAREEFTFIKDSAGTVDVALGDARLVMERETAEPDPEKYDVIIVDAFNGGSVPMHLLTRECFEIYDALLAPGGVLALHLSNNYLELDRVGRGVAADLGMDVALFIDGRERTEAFFPSVWVVATRDDAFLAAVQGERHLTTLDDEPVIWTDQRSALFPLLRGMR